MKLVRLDGNRTGLLVELSSGVHVIDVVASLGMLVPSDPISHGVLNGILKDGDSWSTLIQHWQVARVGLLRMAAIARAHPASLTLQRFDAGNIACPDGIRSLDIEDGEVKSAAAGDKVSAVAPEVMTDGFRARGNVIPLSKFRA